MNKFMYHTGGWWRLSLAILTGFAAAGLFAMVIADFLMEIPVAKYEHGGDVFLAVYIPMLALMLSVAVAFFRQLSRESLRFFTVVLAPVLALLLIFFSPLGFIYMVLEGLFTGDPVVWNLFK